MNPLLSPQQHADPGSGVDARCDQRQREIVDDGLALMRVAGTLSALEYMKSRAVDGRVIARVLLEPARRRGGA